MLGWGGGALAHKKICIIAFIITIVNKSDNHDCVRVLLTVGALNLGVSASILNLMKSVKPQSRVGGVGALILWCVVGFILGVILSPW